uniref:Ras-related GTPase n=1 Tax=Marseillevirus LCMAC101 TaxID=2506602 RepID=A0A481YSP3_9VIRU|nr:MAG: Ras-related GTPase [Marseillevirus LCMAC101]
MALTHYNKTVLVGNEGAGKTSLIYRTQFGEFNHNATATIGATYVKHKVYLDDGNCEVKLHLWDTAGQPRFSALLPMFIKGAKIVLVCFDSPDISLVQRHVGEIDDIDSSVRIILVMTKIDKEYFSRREAMKEYAQSKNLDIFFTSSLTGEGIQELFEEVARHYLLIDSTSDNDTFDLETTPVTNSHVMFTQCCITM